MSTLGQSQPAKGASPAADSSALPVLEVDRLSIAFRGGREPVEAVRSASLVVGRGESVGLVGESGSGKTVTALSSMGLIQLAGGTIVGGSIMFDGRDVTRLPEREWRRIRGARIGMIFQQPGRSLNPALSVGEQICEPLRRHRGYSRRAAWARTTSLLDRVHIPDAQRRARDYPHQFSGGMAQRVMIAMALACEPDLVIADEPTTALDVTVQATILELLRETISETGASLLYISHDLAVVAQVCQRVVVMYAGETMEAGGVEEIFQRPRHPYTSALMGCLPRVDAPSDRLIAIAGKVPRPHEMPMGCRFHPRCSHAQSGRCDVDGVVEPLRPSQEQVSQCVRQDELSLPGAS